MLCIKGQTRNVYEKKLIRLLGKEASVTYDHTDGYDDYEEEDEEEEEEMDLEGE